MVDTHKAKETSTKTELAELDHRRLFDTLPDSDERAQIEEEVPIILLSFLHPTDAQASL